MSVYASKDRKCATATITEIHATMQELTTRTENLGNKL
jgi:hypothetical protein